MIRHWTVYIIHFDIIVASIRFNNKPYKPMIKLTAYMSGTDLGGRLSRP